MKKFFDSRSISHTTRMLPRYHIPVSTQLHFCVSALMVGHLEVAVRYRSSKTSGEHKRLPRSL